MSSQYPSTTIKSVCELVVRENKKFNLNIVHIIDHLITAMPENLNDLEKAIEYTAIYIVNFISDNPEYDYLASAVLLAKININTYDTYAETLDILFKNDLVSERYYELASKNIDFIEKMRIEYQNKPRTFTYFGLKTLIDNYLLRRKEGPIKKRLTFLVERPHDIYLREAVSFIDETMPLDVQKNELAETFLQLAYGKYTHATPTMFNSGTNLNQLASCFLTGACDSLKGLYKLLTKIALISKLSGGLALHLHNVRARGSPIASTNGESDGIIPYIMVLNYTARYVNQSGKRKGAIAVYLEMWHADICDFLELRLNTGNVHERARDIFTAVWMCDLFMVRAARGEKWSLMCPHECPGLPELYGKEFENLYMKYEREGRYVKQVNARDLLYMMFTSQSETGTPYVVQKDHVNMKSNQKNLGTIKCSNLCTEIVQYTSKEEIAVCNLASISLPSFIIEGTPLNYDYGELYKTARISVRNLNRIIDINHYPVKETSYSNMRHRPIGLGVQGLNDVFMRFKLPYESKAALELDAVIFETIYFAALTESNELAKKYGPYKTFEGSPFSEGLLQFHLWGYNENNLSGKWDWKSLIESIKKYGTYNSLLTTVMPTASSSQILGNTESTEPMTANIYTRETQVGNFTIINKYLVKELIKLGLWVKNEKGENIIKEKIIFYNGSVQNIQEIPIKLRQIFKTVWEIDQKYVIDHAAIRGPFIDQTQSMNLYVESPNRKKQTTLLFYSWAKGLKTSMYYLRCRPAVDPIKFNIDAKNLIKYQKEKDDREKKDEICVRRKKNPDGSYDMGECTACSS